MIYLVVFPSLSLVKQFHKIHTNKRKLTLRDCQNKALNACGKDQPVVNISMCTGSGKSYVISNLLQGKVSYYATEGTLGISRIDLDTSSDLANGDLVILTTYISAPRVYDYLYSLGSGLDTYVFHDEAHHIEGPTYKKEYDTYCENGCITKTHNFSATLPEEYTYDYTYPLLRGIQDGVVRDFYTMVVMCSTEDTSASFVEIVEMTHSNLVKMGQKGMRLLVYTSEANTENDVESHGGTSVKSFLEFFGNIARKRGWWMKGLHNDTMRDKDTILREFEANAGISILVSCRTLSEGVDLRNANAMLPWDPSVDSKTNIQRIGRVVRLYKDDTGRILPKEKQTPSLVVIPVYLEKEEYVSIKDDPKKLHDKLHKDINEGMRGPFVGKTGDTMCTPGGVRQLPGYMYDKIRKYTPLPNVQRIINVHAETEAGEGNERPYSCVCTNKIRQCCVICYIGKGYTKNKDDLVVIGNCCCKRFVPKEEREYICSQCKVTKTNKTRTICKSCETDLTNMKWGGIPLIDFLPVNYRHITDIRRKKRMAYLIGKMCENIEKNDNFIHKSNYVIQEFKALIISHWFPKYKRYK